MPCIAVLENEGKEESFGLTGFRVLHRSELRFSGAYFLWCSGDSTLDSPPTPPQEDPFFLPRKKKNNKTLPTLKMSENAQIKELLQAEKQADQQIAEARARESSSILLPLLCST